MKAITNIWFKIGLAVGPAVALFGFFDFLYKWGAFSFLKSFFNGIVLPNLSLVLVFIWLCTITGYIYKIYKNKNLLKPLAPSSDIKTAIGVLEKKLTDQIKGLDRKYDGEISDIKYSLLDLEKEYHLNKNQVGAVSKMIQKLDTNIKNSWGIESALAEIKDYITKSGMPNYYFQDLATTLKKLPEEYDLLKKELTTLAQEKLFDPNKQ